MNALSLFDSSVNVGKTGRVRSLIAGASLLVSGINKMKESPKLSVFKSILGGYLIYRGLTGHCHVNQIANKTTARDF